MKKQTIKKHLKEIRHRFYYIFFPMILIFLVFFAFSPNIINWFLEYYNLDAYVLSPLEYINTQLKLSGILTMVSIIPIILTQLYLFVKPAINNKYKNKITKQIAYSNVLAILGILFGVFIFNNLTLSFLKNNGLENLWGIGSIFDFITFGALSFGVIFQITAIIPFLDKTKILKVETLKKKRKILLFLILLLSAGITPTLDVFSMMVMAVPTYGAFELGILLSKFNKEEKWDSEQLK